MNHALVIDFILFGLMVTAVYYFSVILFYLFLIVTAVREIFKFRKINLPQHRFPRELYPPISILVPAYNEETSIVDSVNALFKNLYPNFNVIVVNDGSKDSTLEKLKENFDLYETDEVYFDKESIFLRQVVIRKIYKSTKHANMIVVDKANGGKSSALNTGIVFAHDYFCSMDADTILMPNSLKTCIVPFLEEKETIAVGAILRVGNDNVSREGKLLKRHYKLHFLNLFQMLEYFRDFCLGRIAWNSINSTLIISGAFGVFKTEAVKAVGGYNIKSVGEDLELLMRLHLYARDKDIPYKVTFIPEEVCWTEVPSDSRTLYNQRNRWHRGLMDSFTANRELLFSVNHGSVGWISSPYYYLVEMMGPVIKIITYLLLLGGLMFQVVNLKFFLLFLLISYLYRVSLNLFTILIDNMFFNKNHSFYNFMMLTVVSMLEPLGYKQFIFYATLTGFVDYFLGKTSWGKMNRSGFSKN